MERDVFAGNWREVRGRVREQWGKLSDDDLDCIDGRRDQLLGALRQRYAKAGNVVDREVRDFERRVAGAATDEGMDDGDGHAGPLENRESGSRGGAGGRSASDEGRAGDVGGGSLSARGAEGKDHG
jgi:uncharacterized protein YjbJ (UPF0337 family)